MRGWFETRRSAGTDDDAVAELTNAIAEHASAMSEVFIRPVCQGFVKPLLVDLGRHGLERSGRGDAVDARIDQGHHFAIGELLAILLLDLFRSQTLFLLLLGHCALPVVSSQITLIPRLQTGF